MERIVDRANSRDVYYGQTLHNGTLTLCRDGPTIVARDDVSHLVSTRDNIREALTLVSFRD